MASVLHFSHLQPSHSTHGFVPQTEHLSLSLDLSLGGLFSNRSGNISFPFGNSKSSNQCSGIRTGSTDLDSPIGRNVGPSPNALHEPADLPRSSSLQVQQRNEARKRRKNIIEGKLRKRSRGEFHTRSEEPTTEEEGEGEEERSMPANETGNLDEKNHVQVELKNAIIGYVHDKPSTAIADCMEVVGSLNEPLMSLKYGVPSNGNVNLSDAPLSEASKQGGFSVPTDGVVNYSWDPPYEGRGKQTANAEVAPSTELWQSENAHCPQVANLASSRSLSRLQTWRNREILDKSFTGDGNNFECTEGSCQSSSSEIENESERGDRSGHNSRESRKSRSGEEAAMYSNSHAHPSAGVPDISVAYSHPFQVMPLSCPYALPLPWGFYLPWLPQGAAYDALGTPVSSVVQASPAVPGGMAPEPYGFPLQEGSMAPWMLPLIPSGTGIGGASLENASPVPASGDISNSLVDASLYKVEATSESSQDMESRGELRSLQTALTEGVGQKSSVFTQIREENMRPGHVILHRPLKDEMERDSFVGDDDSIVNIGSQEQTERGSSVSSAADSIKVLGSLDKGQSRGWQADVSEKHVDGAVTGETSGKRKKVVSFALTTEPFGKKQKIVSFVGPDNGSTAADPSVVRANSKARQPTGHKEAYGISSQGSLNCFIACSREDPKPPLCGNTNILGNCDDGRQGTDDDAEKNDRMAENWKTTDDHSADHRRHSENIIVGNGCGETKYQQKEGRRGADPEPCSMNDVKDKGRQPCLPRVTTRGSGPQGRTIHGVMYITKDKRVRLICLCHGKHMSPAEFVEHSGSSDLSNPERNIIIEFVPAVDRDISVCV